MVLIGSWLLRRIDLFEKRKKGPCLPSPILTSRLGGKVEEGKERGEGNWEGE